MTDLVVVGSNHSGASTDQQLIELWLSSSSGSRHTRDAYVRDVARFLAHAQKPLGALTLADVLGWASTLVGGAESSTARRLSACKSLLSFAHKTGYITFNVGAAVRLPKLRNNLAQRILTEEELVRLVAASSDPVRTLPPGGCLFGSPQRRNHALLRLLYVSGARVSELCALNWEHIQPSQYGATLTLHGKGGKTRHVLVPQATADELASFRDGSPDHHPVFVTRQNKRMGAHAVWALIKVIAKKAGILKPVSPHWFRHARASHALDRGAPISMVQADLGHASVATTGRYLHARPGDGSARYLPL